MVPTESVPDEAAVVASAVLNSTGIHNGEEIFIHSLVRLLVDMFDKCEFRVGGVYHQKLW